MNANTGIWIGLGVLGVLVVASMGSEHKPETASKSNEKPNVEPKKVIL